MMTDAEGTRRKTRLQRLAITFHRDGVLIEREVASNGARALKLALLTLARLDDMQPGDTLQCIVDDIDGKPLPPPRQRQG